MTNENDEELDKILKTASTRYSEMMETIIAIKGKHYSKTLQQSVVFLLVSRTLEATDVPPFAVGVLRAMHTVLLDHYAKTAGTPAVDIASDDFLQDMDALANVCIVRR
jgi:hypothetical protein